jgi:hypothetical protein
MAAREPGARKKLKEFLLQHVGVVLEADDLRSASGNASEWARRVRELRNEEGMNIVTHNDRSELKPGQYMLLDTQALPSFARTMSKETRAYVLDRDGFTCQMCGTAAGESHPFDGRKARLHIGHIIDKSQGGSDDYSNLRAICSVCNEGAANITLDRPTAAKLLAQIRRAPGTEQLAVLEWLILKFPRQSKELSTQKVLSDEP